MRRLSYLSRNGCLFAAAAILAATTITPAPAQQSQTYRGGVVTDWTSRHIVFSDPGTLTDAIMKGRREQWERIVSDPHYQWQQIRRHAPAAQLAADTAFHSSDSRRGKPSPPPPPDSKDNKSTIHRDWSVQISPSESGVAVASWAYPAKFNFYPDATPSCTSDYVVYPVWASGSGTQANIVGVNNLYSGSCTTGAVPSALFAYEVGSGLVYNSPVISVDGTKIAFVETITGGSIFHVLTIDQSGNSGCATSTSPCNGASYATPAVPGVNNNAADVPITLSGGVTDTFSSPYVDYQHDVAYVGDDSGYLHKFTGVFLGTPTEVTNNGWPLEVTAVGSGLGLTSPVYDFNSGDIFVATQYTGGASTTGTLYCINAAATTASFCSTPSIAVGTNIFDGPVLDSTWEQVILTADNSAGSNMILFQTPVNFGSSVTVSYGAAGTYHYTGAFDDAYYSAPSTGHMYACGNLDSAATPVLFRVGFNSSGVMNGSADSSGSYQLVSGGSGVNVSCSPLTEFYNADAANGTGGTGVDYLFAAVGYDGAGSCGGIACMMSFILPTTSPFTFPSGPAETPLTENFVHAFSAVIVDNYSTESGASQVYFGNNGESSGIQASQSALQ